MKRADGHTHYESSRAHGTPNGSLPWMAEIQRARILDATVAVVAERGVASVTVAHIVERSGVSRRTFYEQFSDREDCLLAALERALATVSERVLSACEAQSEWRERVRAGLVALLSFLDEERSIARLLITDSHLAGAAALERRSDVLTALTRAVDQGRKEGNARVTPHALTAEGVVGGVLSVLHARLSGADAQPLLGLTNPLMSMIVLPYMGAPAARSEMKRSLPTTARSAQSALRAPTDPFKESGMRLTYRTVRVLMAIADHPNASNRLVADMSDIGDQGQISKLLARLERAGMITNTEATPGKGSPNSWALTTSGRQVVATIGACNEGGHRWSVT